MDIDVLKSGIITRPRLRRLNQFVGIQVNGIDNQEAKKIGGKMRTMILAWLRRKGGNARLLRVEVCARVDKEYMTCDYT